MRSKILNTAVGVAMAMIAAGLSQASAGIVGYVNLNLTPGWNLFALQLKQINPNANSVFSVSSPPDGSLLYRFDPVAQSYYDAGTYLTGVGWYPLSGDTNDPVLELALGEGFFIWTPQAWVLTIVGEVPQGAVTNPLPANFSLRGSCIPQSGKLQTDLGFPPYQGDAVWRYAAPVFSGHSYDNSAHWQPSEPTLNVSEGFILYRPSEQATTNHWWVRNFTVQFAPSPPAAPTTGVDPLADSQAPEISKLTFQRGNAVLTIQNQQGTAYNVHFSSDRVSWQTVATGQTGRVWQEPARAGSQGYYQLVNP